MEETVKRLEYELGRYKKAVDDRNREIERMQESLDGERELRQVTTGLLGVLIRRIVPASECAGQQQLCLPMAEIRKHIKSGGDAYHCQVENDTMVIEILDKSKVQEG